tara:strand:+ start:528 stop:692 length:165 start_codon:yes stop_codon:yes gene_type:complete
VELNNSYAFILVIKNIISTFKDRYSKELVIYIYFYKRITQNEGEIALLNLSSKK